MKKINVVLIVLLVSGFSAYLLIPNFEKIYIYKTYFLDESYKRMVTESFENNEKSFYRYLLSKTSELKNFGGMSAQLKLAIEKASPEFIKILVNEFDADITQIYSNEPYFLNQTLRNGHIETFDTVCSGLINLEIMIAYNLALLGAIDDRSKDKKAASKFKSRVSRGQSS